MALTPIPTQRDDIGPTTNAIEQQRAYAKALMDSKYTPPNSKFPYYTWANGVDTLLGNVLGARAYNKANAMERQNYAGQNRAGTPVIGATSDTTGAGGPGAGSPFHSAAVSQVGSEPSSDNPPLTRAITRDPSKIRAAALGNVGLSPLDTDQEKPKPDIASLYAYKRDEPPPTRPTSPLTARTAVSSPSKAAIDLSSRGETGKTGRGADHNISRDTWGSKSYGRFGLNSKSGSLQDFVNDNPDLNLTAPVGSKEFDDQWNKTAATQNDKFQEAHNRWYQKNIMGGLTESMTSKGVNPDIANHPGVQAYMADRKVQMGRAGLNTALAAASGASSPQEFITAISQVDKANIPNNFRSYLREHPNDAPGLRNRVDLRHNTGLGMIDPKLTADMVDYHRNPTRLAQAIFNPPDRPLAADTPGASTAPAGPIPPTFPTTTQSGMAQGNLQGEVARAYRGMITAGASPEQAAAQIERLMKIRGGSKLLETGVMPQFEVDAHGIVRRTAPGEIPSMGGVIPGFPGVVKKSETTDTEVQERYNPATGRFDQTIIIPGSGSVPTPPPAVTPKPAPATAPSVLPPTAPAVPKGPITAQTPVPATGPTVAASTPGSLPVLGTPPPVMAAQPGQKLAMVDLKGIDPNEELYKTTKGEPSKLTQLAQAQNIKMPDYDLENPKTDEERRVNEELKWAEEHPSSPLTTPDRFAEAMKRVNDPNTSDYERIDALKKRKGLGEADIKALEDEIKLQNKGFSELQKNIRDAQKQSEHLAPELKVARNILGSEDFHPGPANKLVESIRGFREEAETTFRTWANDAKRRNEEAAKNGRSPTDNAALWDRMADWIKSDHSATANQVYQKILAGSILQSLRGMLGPNAGQFRVQELKMLEQAFGNPSLTLAANKVVMSMIDKINDRNMLIGQMADSYVGKHRKLDPAFETALSRFEQKNPVFKPDEYNELLKIGTTGRTSTEAPAPAPAATPTGTGSTASTPSGMPRVNGRDDWEKLAPGTRYLSPDGKTRIR